MDPKTIKHIILDLGGVLYQTNYPRMIGNFKKMLAPDAGDVNYTKEGQHELFDQLEIGAIEIEAFAEGMRKAYSLAGTNEEVIAAWNSLLDGVIPGRVEAVRKLKERYDLVLLSNTNKFHYQTFHPQSQDLLSLMERCFYSFEMGMRKPETPIYRAVVEEMGWDAGNTLMVDDVEMNIDGALEAGLQGYLARTEEDFGKMMEELAGG